MNRRSAWADEYVESDAQLNDPAWSIDGDSSIASSYTGDSSSIAGSSLSSVSSVSSIGSPTAAKIIGKKPKLKNLPLSRDALQHMQKDVTPSSGSSQIENTSTTCSSSERSSSEVKASIGKSDGDPAKLPSVGSALHAERKCQPCLFVSSQVGCQKAEDCAFCHFSHKGHTKTRPCKAKRERYRRLIAREMAELAEGATTNTSTISSI